MYNVQKGSDPNTFAVHKFSGHIYITLFDLAACSIYLMTAREITIFCTSEVPS